MDNTKELILLTKGLQSEIIELRKDVQSLHVKQEKTFISVQEAAIILDLSVQTVYHYIHQRRIPYYKPNGRNVYFKKGELEEYIERHRIKSDEELDELASNYIVNGFSSQKPQREITKKLLK